MHPVVLSEWTAALENCNAFGVYRLCLVRLENELLRLNLLEDQLNRETNLLVKCRDEKIRIATQYMSARDLMKQKASSWISLRDDNRKLDEMIAEFEKIPIMKSYMERETQAAGQTGSHSPFQSPSLP